MSDIDNIKFEFVPGLNYDPEIRRLFEMGLTHKKIAKELRIPHFKVSKRIEKMRKAGWDAQKSVSAIHREINDTIRVYLYLGKTPQEISELIGISYGAVLSRIRNHSQEWKMGAA